MKSRKIEVYVSAIFLLTIFLFSCGLPNIIYLYPPEAINKPNGSSDDNSAYFEFKTSDEKNNEASPPPPANSYFKGFKIFYKIYESESDCSKEISLANKENESNASNAAEYLGNELGFSLLSHEGSPSKPIITKGAVNRLVSFRLIPFGSEPAEIKVGSIVLGKVNRVVEKDFMTISIDDGDVKKASTSPSMSPSEYYVACFVVAYGMDETYTSVYSEIVSLGYVKINNT